jgi:hypothetical protein
MRPTRPCSVTPMRGGLLVQTPYDAGFVAAIKSIAASERKFDPVSKGWLVDPRHASRIANMVAQYFGETVLIPQMAGSGKPELRVLDVRYVGTCKDRGAEITAFGFSGGEWSVVFPEQVLRQWFEGVFTEQSAPAPNTLYGVLGVRQDVSDDDLKKAFRRLALHNHPDHSKEPDAAERFMQIKDAYDMLSNPRQRARYDVGLLLEASLGKDPIDQLNQINFQLYRAPLRCGYILAEGIETIGRFRVSKILEWADITNQFGQTLVVSWPAGSDRFVEQWV